LATRLAVARLTPAAWATSARVGTRTTWGCSD